MKPQKITRRNFVKTLAGSSVATATGLQLSACNDNDDPLVEPSISFKHGVASGDPLSNRVIIWTRVTPSQAGSYSINWEVADDDQFTNIIANDALLTDASRDYTVKVDATGLDADRLYYYRFSMGDMVSETGQTRTLPTGQTDEIKLGVFSCANYPAGFFHVYAEAAKRDDLHAVVHLGDYIYEYDKDGYASADAASLGRVSVPENELIELDDYRQRYGQYRTDIDLQALHAKVPFICVWDDHEFANDTYINGAENHDATTEGDFLTRQANALKAYYEWMPIREQDTTQPLVIYRSFDFGDLLSLHMLDTRVVGRDQQLDYINYMDPVTGSFDAISYENDLTDASRQLLGATQTSWLQAQMSASTATWQVLGQQVLMGRMNIPAPVALQQISFGDYSQLLAKAATTPAELTAEEQAILAQPSIPYNLDAWDGYFMNRETVLGTALQLDKNLLVISGDTHNAWASDLQDFNGNQVGVEFATSSVSSPGLEDYFPDENPDQVAAGLVQLIEPLNYANTQHRGYMVLTISHAEVQSEWLFIDTVKSADYAVDVKRYKTLKVLPGQTNRKIIDA